MNIPIQTLSEPGQDDSIPATANGPTSDRGRRKAFEDIAKSQWAQFGKFNITLFSLLSTYNIVKHKKDQVKKFHN
jgi:hypothetical protein